MTSKSTQLNPNLGQRIKAVYTSPELFSQTMAVRYGMRNSVAGEITQKIIKQDKDINPVQLERATALIQEGEFRLDLRSGIKKKFGTQQAAVRHLSKKYNTTESFVSKQISNILIRGKRISPEWETRIRESVL